NESGNKWGPGSAPYGIKGKNPNTGASINAATWEDYGQVRVDITDTFRAYGSPAEAMYDFADFLRTNSRYGPALESFRASGDPMDLVRAIHKAGYATDPQWSNKIQSIMARVDT